MLYLIHPSILIINVHLSIDKLDRTNYDTWASNIKLWLKNQVVSELVRGGDQFRRVQFDLCIESLFEQIFRQACPNDDDTLKEWFIRYSYLKMFSLERLPT